jgi:ADP-glucose pyrophosphorylase
MHTRSKERPPVKFASASRVDRSLLSNGCVIQGTVINSVLMPGVRVERGTVVRDSVIMNDTTIKANAQVDCCVLDKEAEIGADARRVFQMPRQTQIAINIKAILRLPTTNFMWAIGWPRRLGR